MSSLLHVVSNPFYIFTLAGNIESLISTLQHTVLSLEQNISVHLFHPNWVHMRKVWNSAVLGATEARHFSRLLLWLVSCIKPVVFNPVWHDSLGHVRWDWGSFPSWTCDRTRNSSTIKFSLAHLMMVFLSWDSQFCKCIANNIDIFLLMFTSSLWIINITDSTG